MHTATNYTRCIIIVMHGVLFIKPHQLDSLCILHFHQPAVSISCVCVCVCVCAVLHCKQGCCLGINLHVYHLLFAWYGSH